MTDFDGLVTDIDRYIYYLSNKIFKAIALEREDARQILLLEAWEKFVTLAENADMDYDTRKSYVMAALRFAAGRTISEEFKKRQVRDRKHHKVLSLVRMEEADHADMVILRASIDTLKEKLTPTEKYICIMIENGYCKSEVAEYLHIHPYSINYYIKKIRKTYEKQMGSAVV